MNTSPFKFLDSYTREDRKIFFGRDREITELYRRVFESKILLVYGISGTGKSSLINCGLASRFDDSDWLPINVRRGTNIVESINEAFVKQSISPLKKNLSISEKLQSIYLDHFKPVYLIFDQFEELFIFGNEEEKRGFIDLIKEIVDSETQCKVIFVIREEFLAGITEFEYDLPEIFANRFRVEKMKRANAILAIEGPCKVHNIETEAGFSEELIDKLCPAGSEIELTYLQIYLDRILRLATTHFPPNRGGQGGAPIPSHGGIKEGVLFSKSLLSQAGNVSDLLGQFLEEQIREIDDPETGMAILKSFVSVQGTKRQMNEPEILDSIRAFGIVLEENVLMKYLSKFVDHRLLRERDEAGHFELRHDALAAKIYEKFTAIEKDIIEVSQFIENAVSTYKKREKLLTADDLKYIAPYEDKLYLSKQSEIFISRCKKEIQRARKRRRNISIISGIVLLLVFAGFTIWALNERGKALEERKAANQNFIKAKATNLVYTSQKFLKTDPTIALCIANYAYTLDSLNPAVVENINKIYYENSFYKIIEKLDYRIYKLAISPDGKSFLIASADNILRLMDMNGNLLQLFRGHTDRINSIVFSPDGSMVLSGSSDSTACLWDLNGNQKKVFSSNDEVIAAAFSPDGKNILIASWKTLNLQDLNGKIIKKIEIPCELSTVAFYPDGKSILTGLADSTMRLWDLNGRLLRVFKGHKDYINSISFSPDRKNILTGSEDRTAILWDLHGNILQVFRDHIDAVFSALFSPDGKYIITCSWDKTARLWDMDGNVLQVFKGHEEGVEGSAFLTGGNSIVTISYDKSVRIWDLDGIRPVSFKRHKDWINSVAFSPDGSKVLTGSDDETVCLWDIKGNVLKVFGDLKESIFSVAFSPDCQNILAGSYFKSTCMWNLKGDIIFEFKVDKEGITSVAFSPDGKNLLTGNIDSLKYCDLKGTVLRGFKNHGGDLYSLTFSPDGKYFLTGSADAVARLWDLEGNILQVFKAHELIVHSVAFSPDGKFILTGSCDNTARLWDLQGNVIQVFKGHNGHVHSVAFSPSGTTILTGSLDKTARLWNIDGNLIQEFKGFGYTISSVAFSPDGKSILTGSEDNTARLWAIKKPFNEFLEGKSFQELSITQKLKYGILEIGDVIKFEDERSLDEAAEFYFGEISKINKNYRAEYIANAQTLFNRLLSDYQDSGYVARKDSLIRLQKGLSGNLNK